MLSPFRSWSAPPPGTGASWPMLPDTSTTRTMSQGTWDTAAAGSAGGRTRTCSPSRDASACTDSATAAVSRPVARGLGTARVAGRTASSSAAAAGGASSSTLPGTSVDAYMGTLTCRGRQRVHLVPWEWGAAGLN